MRTVDRAIRRANFDAIDSVPALAEAIGLETHEVWMALFGDRSRRALSCRRMLVASLNDETLNRCSGDICEKLENAIFGIA